MENKKYALLSVTDKTGIEDFARELVKRDFTILSTGGTAARIKEAGVDVTEVSKYTGMKESPDGMLKTIHQKVLGGILCNNPENPAMIEYANENGFHPIEIVGMNLYEFEKAAESIKEQLNSKEISLEQAVLLGIKQSDVGGPTDLRAAAKASALANFSEGSSIPIVDPSDYQHVLASMNKNNGNISIGLRKHLAVKVYDRTAAYEAAIRDFLHEKMPEANMNPADLI
jgi:phosphoribosylaminoimidazolecarboxamide formyltransferase / IMP cyclohydrolase